MSEDLEHLLEEDLREQARKFVKTYGVSAEAARIMALLAWRMKWGAEQAKDPKGT